MESGNSSSSESYVSLVQEVYPELSLDEVSDIVSLQPTLANCRTLRHNKRCSSSTKPTQFRIDLKCAKFSQGSSTAAASHVEVLDTSTNDVLEVVRIYRENVTNNKFNHSTEQCSSSNSGLHNVPPTLFSSNTVTRDVLHVVHFYKEQFCEVNGPLQSRTPKNTNNCQTPVNLSSSYFQETSQTSTVTNDVVETVRCYHEKHLKDVVENLPEAPKNFTSSPVAVDFSFVTPEVLDVVSAYNIAQVIFSNRNCCRRMFQLGGFRSRVATRRI